MDDFVTMCRLSAELFIKPVSSCDGKEARMISVADILPNILFQKLKNENVITKSVIRQHDSLNIGNNSINTILIVTVLDTLGNVHIVSARISAGVGDSVVDNVGAHGVCYEIDINSGTVIGLGESLTDNKIVFHPGTDICILGNKLPYWQQALEVVEKAANKLYQCRFVGWDLAITSTGVELIEGNYYPYASYSMNILD